MKDREALTAVIVSAIVSSLMLLYAVFGRPTYGYFGLMRVVVAGSAAFCAVIIWKCKSRFVPVAILLVAFGALILLGKMRRADWLPFDWCAIVLFLAVALICAFGLREGKPI